MADHIREIVLDTETTGLSPEEGHRIIEIGALELINHMPTGNKLHLYIQPQRDIEEAAEKVHGISSAFLADKPVFSEIADQFLEFIKDDKMIIHNAAFDMGFINAELTRLGHAPLPDDRALDTLALARRKFPGAQTSLDALCRRFEIDNSHRDLHGALIDADLLAEVYIELIGGRQPDLGLNRLPETSASLSPDQAANDGFEIISGPLRQARPHEATSDEIASHEAFLDTIKDPIWRR
ncbi:MAG: DNA polymerase III subunit epsilon [Candidatus Puniceispirillaceae bacterium]